MQKTLKCEATFSGTGLFTGEKVSINLLPALPKSGIVFQRIDLPGKPCIPARLEFVSDTMRCTKIAAGGAHVMTVEHLLSALSACGIDNAKIEVDGAEVPAGDGSAQSFVELIEQSAEQDEPKQFYFISEPVFWSDKDTHLIALPCDEFRISYTLHYPQSPLLRSQYFSIGVHPESYKKQIAPCRTFSLYEEIAPLIEKGLIKGGGLENAVVVQGDRILNPEGARFPDEMVRHKILDLIGDLSLLGISLRAHIVAIRSGHASNIAFAKKLLKLLKPDFLTLMPKTKACLQGVR